MKIGNDGNLVLGPFDESTPCLMIVLMNCQTKLRINHLTAVKSVAILEIHLIWLNYVWVPSHVGVPGNERADQKAKQGAKSTQPEVPLTLRRAKSIISTYIDKYTAMTQKTKSFGKPWETLATVCPIPRHLERAKAVACFRLTTGHDFLGVYLHWLGVAANEVCPICGHARMDDDHLLQCTGLDEYLADDIVSRYWEVRRQMVKKLSTGVG
ncbi:reverse transcriptase [Trichonephila clavipes]|nr:reverse transcriptase [Trichonephila clavipes]